MHTAQVVIIALGIYSIAVAKKNRKEQTLWVLLIGALLGWGGFFANIPYL